jgi:dsRNA-specific ribonuclease
MRAAAEGGTKKKKMKRQYILTDPLPKVREASTAEYREFIIQLLMKRGNVKKEEAEKYLDEAGMKIMLRAMTHDSVSPSERAENYEMLEHLGDPLVNAVTAKYLSRRFRDTIIKMGDPGVFIISRQKSLLTSKPFFAKFSNELGLSRFIRFRPLKFTYAKEDSAGHQTIQDKFVVLDRSMREDVFEAFFAALDQVIDEKEAILSEGAVSEGVGYSIVYRIMASFYDEQNIPTTKTVLVDAKTQLKEIFDTRKKFGDKLTYDVNPTARTLTLIIHFQVDPVSGEEKPLDIQVGPFSTSVSQHGGEDYETNQKLVEQLAAKEALRVLQAKYGKMFVRYKDEL